MTVEIEQQDLDALVAVAAIYLDAVGKDELVSLTEAYNLTRLRDIVDRYNGAEKAPA